MYDIDAETQTWTERAEEGPWRDDLAAAEGSYVARCRLIRFGYCRHGFNLRPFLDDVWEFIAAPNPSETGALLLRAILDWCANYGGDAKPPQPITAALYRVYIPDVVRPHPDWQPHAPDAPDRTPPEVRIAPTLRWLRDKLVAEIQWLPTNTFQSIVGGVAAVAYTIVGADIGPVGAGFAGDRAESAEPWRVLPALLPRIEDDIADFHFRQTVFAGLFSENVFIRDAVLDAVRCAYAANQLWTEKILARIAERFDPMLNGEHEKKLWAAAGRELPETLRPAWRSHFQ